MTRQRDLAAGCFHITCHSVWDGVLYRDDVDRTNYVHELARITSEIGWTVISACLMTTHVHLIVEVEDDLLAEAMQDLNFRYASGFNARHRRRGRVFGAPYGSHRVQDDSHLLTVYRYVALNPVEAGLARRPGEWPWGSCAAAIGVSENFTFVDPTRLYESLGGPREVAMARLRRFLEDS